MANLIESIQSDFKILPKSEWEVGSGLYLDLRLGRVLNSVQNILTWYRFTFKPFKTSQTFIYVDMSFDLSDLGEISFNTSNMWK